MSARGGAAPFPQRRTLAERQAALVAALVAGAPVPDGFDPVRIEAARRALLRKRAGDVARHWPLLAASFGRDWPAVFAEWAATRPTEGSYADGLAFARSVPLSGPAAEELAARTRGRLSRLVRRLAGSAAWTQADLGDPLAADRVVAAARERFGRLDGALTSVGGPPRESFETIFLGAVRMARTVATGLGDGARSGHCDRDLSRGPLLGGAA